MTTVDGGGVTIVVSLVPSLVSVTVTTGGGGAGRVVDGRLGVVTVLVLSVGLVLALLILTARTVAPPSTAMAATAATTKASANP